MRLASWLVIPLVSLATAPVAFVVLARHHVGEPRPVGTICDFEHDPGSGCSADGRVQRRGRLVPREACVHATDGENEQPVGLAAFVGALGAPVATASVLTSSALWWKRVRNQRSPRAPAGVGRDRAEGAELPESAYRQVRQRPPA